MENKDVIDQKGTKGQSRESCVEQRGKSPREDIHHERVVVACEELNERKHDYSLFIIAIALVTRDGSFACGSHSHSSWGGSEPTQPTVGQPLVGGQRGKVEMQRDLVAVGGEVDVALVVAHDAVVAFRRREARRVRAGVNEGRQRAREEGCLASESSGGGREVSEHWGGGREGQ